MTWVKICGLTSPAAAQAVLAADADAAGFVFAPSPRRLDIADARRLATALRGRIRCVAVVRHATQAQIDEIVTEFRPDVLQIDAEEIGRLRLPQTLELLPVVRGWDGKVPLPARMLFEGVLSGSGRPCDWDAARAAAPHGELVLAGGLKASNLAAAIGRVRPYGVDTSSGVESAPGVKDPEAIALFVHTARECWRALESASGSVDTANGRSRVEERT